MGGRGAQSEAAVGVAHGIGEPRAAGHDEQRVALAELGDRRAQRAQRVVAGPAAEPAADDPASAFESPYGSGKPRKDFAAFATDYE